MYGTPRTLDLGTGKRACRAGGERLVCAFASGEIRAYSPSLELLATPFQRIDPGFQSVRVFGDAPATRTAVSVDAQCREHA